MSYNRYSRGGSSHTRNNNNNFRSRGNFRRRSNRNKIAKTSIHPSKYISKSILNSEAPVKTSTEVLRFTDLNLNSTLARNLEQKGFNEATAIQSQVIPAITHGKDVLGISSTGSGKTGAFLIPMINKILNDSSQSLLVIAPTRELAMQIQKEAVSLVKGTFIRVERVIGGESIGRQAAMLKRQPNIVIGTPGRIDDMNKREILNLSTFNNIVLDEVDRMLDMGFVHDIKRIYSKLSDKKQALFFSATIDNRVEGIISSLSDSYESFKLDSNTSARSVNQDVVRYSSPEEKIEKLKSILIREEVTKTLVFIETKRHVDKVAKLLSQSGLKVGSIHGDKTQGNRKAVIQSYRLNKFQILIATNVAARGLDVDDISHVINFDEPQTYDEYIHRIGRTGRNGKSGTAYTFVKG